MPSHPHSEGLCMRKPFTFAVLRISLMFIVGCSLSAIVMQFLTYCRLAGHLIFLPFASALQATVACLIATFCSSADFGLIGLATLLRWHMLLACQLVAFPLGSALAATG